MYGAHCCLHTCCSRPRTQLQYFMRLRCAMQCAACMALQCAAAAPLQCTAYSTLLPSSLLSQCMQTTSLLHDDVMCYALHACAAPRPKTLFTSAISRQVCPSLKPVRFNHHHGDEYHLKAGAWREETELQVTTNSQRACMAVPQHLITPAVQCSVCTVRSFHLESALRIRR